MILQFKYPLRRLGFKLGNGPEMTVATLKAFTASGQLLGQVERGGIQELEGRPFLGVETSHPAGISTAVLDYGSDEVAEQISDLRLEYLHPRNFFTYPPPDSLIHLDRLE